MRVLITGGSGFLGAHMTRFLLDRGHPVRSLDLVPFDVADLRDDIEEVVGDIRDPETVASSVAGVDVVIHAAAALPLYSPEDIRSTDVGGTRVVLQAALDAGVGRVVMVSSTAVYGVPDHHPLVEDDPLIGVGPYGEAKVAAERLCAEFRAQGICVPVVRPKTFVGPGRLGVFALLFDWAYTGHGFPVLGRGDNRYQLLDVEDLCDALYRCATLADVAVNDTFNVGAAVFGTIREDFQAVLDRAGYGKEVRSIPAQPAIAVLRLLETFGLSPLYEWVYETASADSYVSTEKAERVLGWHPRYSNAQSLVRSYDWYVEHVGEFAGREGITHRVPWRQGVLSLAKWLF